MEFFKSQSNETLLLAFLIGCITFLLFYFLVFFRVQKGDLENPVDFVVPFPEQCKAGWEGRVLDNPSVKV